MTTPNASLFEALRRRHKRPQPAACRRRECDYCWAIPERRFRVVDENWNVVWDGVCRACAYQVASHKQGWHVV